LVQQVSACLIWHKSRGFELESQGMRAGGVMLICKKENLPSFISI
jgi:hypothetical protein